MIQHWLARFLLSPFSLLYGIGISLRNAFYDSKFLKSTKFNLPVIGVGNLSIGGAGKTPHVEYLISLLQPYIDVAVLSRGYKRKSKGFRFVDIYDKVFTSGDEPIQYKRKFRDVVVAVAESRVTAIPEIVKQYPQIDCILLDDSFQHRSVSPGLNILLTEFDRPYTEDYLLPMGRLREWRSDAERADCIIVTKCPDDLTDEDREEMSARLNALPQQEVFFSKYAYFNPYLLLDGRQRLKLDTNQSVILLSAIASSDYLEEYLSDKVGEVASYKFEDHHYFTERDLQTIAEAYKNLDSQNKFILTTEKDAVRLFEHKEFLIKHQLPVLILPIAVQFDPADRERFNQYVKSYLMNVKV